MRVLARPVVPPTPEIEKVEVLKPGWFSLDPIKAFIGDAVSKILSAVFSVTVTNFPEQKREVTLVDKDGEPVEWKPKVVVKGGSGGGSNVNSKVNIIGDSTVGDGTVTVDTAGTRQQLPSQRAARVFIQANSNNTGDVVVGGVTVIANISTRRGIAIYPSQWVEFRVSNLNLLYVDSTVSGDKINYYYEYTI